MNRRTLIALDGCMTQAIVGRGDGSKNEGTVVYSALDQEFADPVLRAYGQQTGVDVVSEFDVESTKTVANFLTNEFTGG